jgi:predicted  nucleic acid-binding Zn-ribbon protein
MKAQFINELEFNFGKNPPYKRFISTRGISRPRSFNPNKSGYGDGLSPEESEIIDRYKIKIQEFNEDIEKLEYQIEDLNNEIDGLKPEERDPGELEEFYADIQNRYGEKALDILNSGYSDEEKIKAIDELNPAEDFGIRDFRDLMHNYSYYHPEEVDNTEKIEEIEKKIHGIATQIEQIENRKEKLETKIYNIEHY